MILSALLLALALGQIAARLFGWPSLAARLLPQPRGRPPFLVWAGRLWLAFGLPALTALLLIGRGDALVRAPAEFAKAQALARTWGAVQVWPTLLGLLLGTALSTLLAWVARRRGRGPFYLGKPPGLPRGPRELPAAAALAVSAGVAEELYFRLVLPLLVAIVTGSALLAFVVQAVLFGAVHRYQGWVGMVATGLVGLFMAWSYLSTGALWLAMLFHAAIDLNALVLRPALARFSPGRA